MDNPIPADACEYDDVNLHDTHAKARNIVNGIMLTVIFFSITLLGIHHPAFWFISQSMSMCFALCHLWLHWYLHRFEQVKSGASLWHQLLHWFAFLLAVYLVTRFVSAGLFTSSQAGLITACLLAMNLILIGAYTDPIYLLAGVAMILNLGIVAAGYDNATLLTSLSTLFIVIVNYLIIQWQRKQTSDPQVEEE